jgi:cobalamin biosynthesis protein CobT
MNRLFVKYGLLLLLMLFPLSVSAQKEVRKNIRKGNKEYSQQKYSEATASYENAVKGNPSSREANYNLGNTLYKRKEWDKSIEQYNHFISLEQENPTEALRLNPEDDEARYNLAVVQKMIQDKEQQDQGEGEQEQQKQEQQQNNNQQNQTPQNQNDKEKKAEQSEQPEQMSRDNARQLLQAIEQDEKQTQDKVQQIKAQEREEQAENNRRNNKNW